MVQNDALCLPSVLHSRLPLYWDESLIPSGIPWLIPSLLLLLLLFSSSQMDDSIMESCTLYTLPNFKMKLHLTQRSFAPPGGGVVYLVPSLVITSVDSSFNWKLYIHVEVVTQLFWSFWYWCIPLVPSSLPASFAHGSVSGTPCVRFTLDPTFCWLWRMILHGLGQRA